MATFELNEGVYIAPTPAGAYYCVSGEESNPSRQLIAGLLGRESTQLLTAGTLAQITGLDDAAAAMELIYEAQAAGWLEGHAAQMSPPQGTLEDLLPALLAQLSDAGQALLADAQGFYVCSEGFEHDIAEELSAVSADIATLHGRHQGLLQNQLGLGTGAWSLVDAAGNSQLGFWPMFVGDQRFVLVVGGLPHMNNPALTQLVWSLCKRYGVPISV